MDVHVVGDDPVREAVVAALADVDVGVRDATTAEVEAATLAVVTDVAGAESFRRANEAALAGGTPWLAVEVGGAGGTPLESIDATVSGHATGTGCYGCLRARVASTVTEPAEEPRADRGAVRLAGAIAGRECVRLLSGDDRTIPGSLVEVGDEQVRRRFLPVPGCDCQDETRNRAFSDPFDDETMALDEAVERANLAIDERVGPVTSIAEAESFPAPYYLATTADTRAYADERAPEQAAGVDTDWNAALMKAVGEALERYCAAVYTDDDFVLASYAELADDGVPDDAVSGVAGSDDAAACLPDEAPELVAPTDLVRPSDAASFDQSTTCRWVAGRNLATGKPALLPAAAVHFPQPGERLVPPITTGLGLGSSTVDAIVSGLTEVIERDATMLAWYSTFEPLGLSVADEGFDALARRARSEGLTVTPMLVTQDVDLPVVSVAVHRDEQSSVGSTGAEERPADQGRVDDWPRFAVGSAAGLDATAAARSALTEALQNWMELRGIGPEEANEASAWIGEYADFPSAARSFVDVERTVPVDSVGPDPVPTGREALDAVVDRTTAADLGPYAVCLTTRDVDELGFEAVRVVVPGAQPLFTDDPLFAERARSVPGELGFDPWLDREPHPYP